MSPCTGEITVKCGFSASKSLLGNEASSLLSIGWVEGACNGGFPARRNERHNRSLMDARSERAPRECLILGSALTLVGPVSVFGPKFGQCVRISTSRPIRRACLFYYVEPFNLYGRRPGCPTLCTPRCLPSNPVHSVFADILRIFKGFAGTKRRLAYWPISTAFVRYPT